MAVYLVSKSINKIPPPKKKITDCFAKNVSLNKVHFNFALVTMKHCVVIHKAEPEIENHS